PGGAGHRQSLSLDQHRRGSRARHARAERRRQDGDPRRDADHAAPHRLCRLRLPDVPLLSESPDILPIHRKILAFSFIGWIFDFYDLLLLTFLISTTTLTKDLALSQQDQSVLLGTALAFTAVGGFIGGALGDRYGRKPM